MKPQYEPKDLQSKLGYLVEECGEVMAAVGKTIRWGLESTNPELPPEERETNREWILRELVDLERAVTYARAELDEQSARDEPAGGDGALATFIDANEPLCSPAPWTARAETHENTTFRSTQHLACIRDAEGELIWSIECGEPGEPRAVRALANARLVCELRNCTALRAKGEMKREQTAFDRYVSERRKDPKFEREYQAAKAELAGSPEPTATGESDEDGARRTCLEYHVAAGAGMQSGWWSDMDKARRDGWIAAYRFARDIGAAETRATLRGLMAERLKDATIAESRAAAAESDRDRALTMASDWAERARDLEAGMRAAEGKLAERDGEIAAVRAALCKLADVELDTGETTRELVRLVELDLNCEHEQKQAAEAKLAAWEPVVVAVGMATSPSDQAPLAIACSRFDALPPEFRPSKETT